MTAGESVTADEGPGAEASGGPPAGPLITGAGTGTSGARRGRRGKRARPLSLHRFRRIFQILFLLLFLGLLTMTVWPLGTVFLGGFLLSDPLIAVNSLANSIVKWELLLAVPVLLSPLFLGRAFCGYVCPMGFLVELFGPRKERHPGVRTRAVLRRVPLFGLVATLFLILFGSAVFLVFDPLSIFTRSMTTLLYPALDRGSRWGAICSTRSRP